MIPWRRATEMAEIVPASPLGPSAHHFIEVKDRAVYNSLRLSIYPDGGVARLRVYGEPVAQWDGKDRNAVYELSNIANGGRILVYNDAHYGSVWTLLLSGRGINMGDGWETRRRREPGNDWIIVKLGAAGTVERIEALYRPLQGQLPGSLFGAGGFAGRRQRPLSPAAQLMFWRSYGRAEARDGPHPHLRRQGDPRDLGRVNHVKLNIFPDGGVSRLRIFGQFA